MLKNSKIKIKELLYRFCLSFSIKILYIISSVFYLFPRISTNISEKISHKKWKKYKNLSFLLNKGNFMEIHTLSLFKYRLIQSTIKIRFTKIWFHYHMRNYFFCWTNDVNCDSFLFKIDHIHGDVFWHNYQHDLV